MHPPLLQSKLYYRYSQDNHKQYERDRRRVTFVHVYKRLTVEVKHDALGVADYRTVDSNHGEDQLENLNDEISEVTVTKKIVGLALAG